MKNRLIRAALLLAAVLPLCHPCLANNPTSNLSGTITTTNTFQLIQGVNTGRAGCSVEDKGTHTMYVFFESAGNDPTCANATTANSASLTAGQSLNCVFGFASVLGDQICITGTSGDSFFAYFE